jgi:Coenzyme PQQ synthesis protein D (PqqD)
MNLSANSRVVAVSNHVSCELGGEAVILNLADCIYFGLNETALAIWQFIQKPAFVWQIRDEIIRKFQVDADSCERDILNLLGQLKDSSLLQVVAESAQS